MLLRMLASAAIVVTVVACGGDTEPTPSDPELPPPSGCEPPKRLVGESCLEPGVQDDGCPAGTLAIDGAGAAPSCRPAGVPAELCADGFEHDGDASCDPILPPAPCPKGQMALPGEVACHAVMPCGAGQWGDIPVDGTTIYVDADYLGNDSDGSSNKPWLTITEAVTGAADDALIAVAAGSYVEDVYIQERVRLWGVCPAQVELVGTAAGQAALVLGLGSSGSEVRGLAFTGEKFGIGVVAAQGVVLEQVWVHDTLDRGVSIEGNTTSVTLRRSLVEAAHEFGVVVAAADATIQSVVVRGTLPATDQRYGRGIIVQDNLNSDPATALIERSVIEDNHDAGVFVGASQVTLDGVVVRGTLPRALDGLGGRGIAIVENPFNSAPSTALVSSSVVEDNHGVGVLVANSSATLDGVVVRRTLPRPSDNANGRGVVIQLTQLDGAPANALVASSVVEDNHDVGVFVSRSTVMLEGVIVRGTAPRASDLQLGIGIVIQQSLEANRPVSALIKGSLVEQNYETGVLISGSEATLEGVVVRQILPRASDQQFGLGISIQAKPDVGIFSTVLVAGSLVEECHVAGVLVNGSHATIDALLVRRIMPRALDGASGDGVAIAGETEPDGTPINATALMTRSRSEQNARAGLGAFGGHVSLGETALSCNGFDLDGETVFELPYGFENLGGNGCGCPEPTDPCTVQTSGLAPPEPISDPI